MILCTGFCHFQNTSFFLIFKHFFIEEHLVFILKKDWIEYNLSVDKNQNSSFQRRKSQHLSSLYRIPVRFISVCLCMYMCVCTTITQISPHIVKTLPIFALVEVGRRTNFQEVTINIPRVFFSSNENYHYIQVLSQDVNH